MKHIIFFLVILAVTLMCSVSVGASPFVPEAYEYHVWSIASWIQPSPVDDPDYEPTANIGIILASDNCPNGGIELNFEIAPNIYLDEITAYCDQDLTINDMNHANVMGHILELKLQYGLNTDAANWIILNMDKSEFWAQIFAAAAAAENALQQQYYHDRVFVPMVGSSVAWETIPPAPTPNCEILDCSQF